MTEVEIKALARWLQAWGRHWKRTNAMPWQLRWRITIGRNWWWN